LLKGDPEVRLRPIDIDSVDLNEATGGSTQSSDDFQERRLAATTRAQQRYELTGLKIKGDIADRDQRPLRGPRKFLPDITETPERRRRTLAVGRIRRLSRWLRRLCQGRIPGVGR
jgi:hypothetical protein